MLDWILVYLVVFFFVFLFQRMVTFFDPPAVKKKKNLTIPAKNQNVPVNPGVHHAERDTRRS